MTREATRTRTLGALSLSVSVGTLLCCALPSLLVFLGFGAAVASAVSSLPFLVTLSRRKIWVFAAAGVLLAVGFGYRRWVAPRFTAAACPPDNPTCATLDRWSGRLLWLSAILYAVGVAVAYGLPVVLQRLDG